MRILVITKGAWRTDNNTGNTLNNFFDGMKANFYNLSFRDFPPNNNVSELTFAISEIQIVNHIRNGKEVGKIVEMDATGEDVKAEENIYLHAKKHRSTILQFLREILWSCAHWNNSALDKFLLTVDPDIIFMPVFDSWYSHKVLAYAQKVTGAKIVLFHADDNYTVKFASLSLGYILYRLILRKWVKASVRISDLNYAISEIQKNEYEQIFKKNFQLLYKGYNFNCQPAYERNKILRFVYTGNIEVGRYKTLALIGKTMDEINRNGKKAELHIYTMSYVTKCMKKALLDIKSIVMHGAVSQEEVKKVQEGSDVLLHIESFEKKSRIMVHQSFSTKIVDYMQRGRCIFAVGPEDVASIDYLLKNDSALVATKDNQIKAKLLELINDESLIPIYANKAWKCGKRNHQIKDIQNGLMKDFEELLNEGSAD